MRRTPGSNTRNYPTALADHQWRVLRPLSPERKERGRPPKHSRRDIINTIIYIKQTGCRWRMLPRDFPKGMTIDITCGLPKFIKPTLSWIPRPVLRPAGISGLIVLPKRRIAVRTSAWIRRARRNAKDYERRVESGVAMVPMTMIHLMLERLEKTE